MQAASSLAVALIALAIEAAFGYPAPLFRRIGHPVTWIGALIAALDRRLNREPHAARRLAGFSALAILLLVVGVESLLAQGIILAFCASTVAIVTLGLLASTCLAQRSLHTHVRDVRDALHHEGLQAGRQAVAMIVGRDTAGLDEAGVARAAIESLAENFADGIVAPTLYLALAGLPGGLLYKAINTADSMIGHRTPRHDAFGFASAKLDDLVNWPAARLAALWVVLAAALTRGASATNAWRIMRRDARGHASPNAGWPEAAMAGALGVTLGGPRVYAGRAVEDAAMGDGAGADLATIDRALTLYRRACALNAFAVLLVFGALLVFSAPPILSAPW